MNARAPGQLDAFFDELTAWCDDAGVPFETLRYGDHPDQELDLRLPADGARGVVLVLHGGFWRAPFTRRNTGALAAALTQAGWATANVEYRRLGPGAHRPMLDDVAAAARRVAELGLGPAVAMGHSAGGHLALWLAAQGGASAAVPLGGVCDLTAAAEAGLGADAVREFLGDADSAYDEVDPARRLPLGVPQILVHGIDDDRVPIEHARAYAARATAAGDDCRLLELHADHFDVIDPRSAAWPAVRDAAGQLLRED
jgi:acetyl esterase/lipase